MKNIIAFAGVVGQLLLVFLLLVLLFSYVRPPRPTRKLDPEVYRALMKQQKEEIQRRWENLKKGKENP